MKAAIVFFSACLALAAAPMWPSPAMARANDEASLRRYCDSGDVHDCIEVANDYYRGDGVQANPRLAASMYQTLCDRYQNGSGCANVASAYEDGIAMTKDMATAAKYYNLGCQLNSAYACDWLNRQRERQRSTAPNPTQMKEARRALLAEAAYWKGLYSINAASLRDFYFHVSEDGKPRVHVDFTYITGESGWAEVQLKNSVVECIENNNGQGACNYPRSKEDEVRYRREHPGQKTILEDLMSSSTGSSSDDNTRSNMHMENNRAAGLNDNGTQK